ncbi:MAG: hypothetical protein HPY65_13705 [Syntrophaceae bacterium]|nr:hypothetical protein [Syntrophaceae bacterium]
MKKQHEPIEKVRSEAEELLLAIAVSQTGIDLLTEQFNGEVERLKAHYEGMMAPMKATVERDGKALQGLMKANKAALFDGTDVVRLLNGTLIRESGDKVTIPKTALAKCEELGFTDVIKTVKSLDRDAVEKWPDTKLFLIGATRKPGEKFEYELKR